MPSSALEELRRLAARDVRLASAAQALAERFRRIATEEHGDDAVVAIARRLRATVVTADAELATRLGAAGRPVLRPRDRARLTRVEPPASPSVRRHRGNR